jgi:enoyl-CoA hydratase
MRAGQRVMLLVEKMQKPVIAAVNGFALGGGLELALACDFIYASEKAKLGLPEVGLGIMPGFGGTQNLSRLVGPNKAKELIFTGKMITAQKALAWGIVNEVFAPAELMERTLETAREIAGKGTLGVRYAKDSVAAGLNMAKEDGFRYEASLLGVLFSTEDQREGMSAFIEKRKAAFQGK